MLIIDWRFCEYIPVCQHPSFLSGWGKFRIYAKKQYLYFRFILFCQFALIINLMDFLFSSIYVIFVSILFVEDITYRYYLNSYRRNHINHGNVNASDNFWFFYAKFYTQPPFPPSFFYWWFYLFIITLFNVGTLK